MAKEKSVESYDKKIGEVNISNDVIETIADLTAKEIEGVKGLQGGITEDIAGLFSKKGHTKGISVEIIDEEIYMDLNIVVDFGVKIPEIAWKVQENIKSVVESMTDLKIGEINVNISGINYKK